MFTRSSAIIFIVLVVAAIGIAIGLFFAVDPPEEGQTDTPAVIRDGTGNG